MISLMQINFLDGRNFNTIYSGDTLQTVKDQAALLVVSDKQSTLRMRVLSPSGFPPGENILPLLKKSDPPKFAVPCHLIPGSSITYQVHDSDEQKIFTISRPVSIPDFSPEATFTIEDSVLKLRVWGEGIKRVRYWTIFSYLGRREPNNGQWENKDGRVYASFPIRDMENDPVVYKIDCLVCLWDNLGQRRWTRVKIYPNKFSDISVPVNEFEHGSHAQKSVNVFPIWASIRNKDYESVQSWRDQVEEFTITIEEPSSESVGSNIIAALVSPLHIIEDEINSRVNRHSILNYPCHIPLDLSQFNIPTISNFLQDIEIEKSEDGKVNFFSRDLPPCNWTLSFNLHPAKFTTFTYIVLKFSRGELRISRYEDDWSVVCGGFLKRFKNPNDSIRIIHKDNQFIISIGTEDEFTITTRDIDQRYNITLEILSQDTSDHNLNIDGLIFYLENGTPGFSYDTRMNSYFQTSSIESFLKSPPSIIRTTYVNEGDRVSRRYWRDVVDSNKQTKRTMFSWSGNTVVWKTEDGTTLARCPISYMGRGQFDLILGLTLSPDNYLLVATEKYIYVVDPKIPNPFTPVSYYEAVSRIDVSDYTFNSILTDEGGKIWLI